LVNVPKNRNARHEHKQIKVFVIACKNFLFADTDTGVGALCTHFSLLCTAMQHGHEPYRYVLHILCEVPHCRNVEDFEALIPWRLSTDVLKPKAA
jgi:transposase